jgi:hypothetical protein
VCAGRDRLRRWLSALLLAMTIAVPLASALIRLAGWERSTWLRVVGEADHPDPPSRSAASR